MSIRVRLLLKGNGGPPKWVLRAFMLAGFAGIGYSAWALLDGALYQKTQRAHFNEEIIVPVALASAPATLPNPIPASPAFLQRIHRVFEPDPAVMGEFLVPRIHMSVMFREGVDDATLRRAAGHVPSTALPGENGNTVLIAHRDTFFRPLKDIEMNDVVQLRTKHGEFEYVIDSLTIVEPSDVPLAGDSNEATLTLVTCYPFGYIGPAPRRFVARAHMVDPQ